MFFFSHSNTPGIHFASLHPSARHAGFCIVHCSLFTVHSIVDIYYFRLKFTCEMWIFGKYSCSNFVHFHLSGQFFFSLCRSSPLRTFKWITHICSVVSFFAFIRVNGCLSRRLNEAKGTRKKRTFIRICEQKENEEWEERRRKKKIGNDKEIYHFTHGTIYIFFFNTSYDWVLSISDCCCLASCQ